MDLRPVPSLTVFVAIVLLQAVPAIAEPLTVQKPIGFAKDAMVRDAVRDECELQTRLPDFVAEAATGWNVSFAEDIASVHSGKVLALEITETDEHGNAFTGRSKSLTVKGELRENGKVIGSFRARRSTMGGVFGGYKGNCAFFGRCAKAIGQDIAGWLQKPGMNSVLSD